MGLSNKKEEQLRKMPIVRCSVAKSKSGKYVVHRTSIVDIKPLAYYEAVFNGKSAEDELQEELQEFE